MRAALLTVVLLATMGTSQGQTQAAQAPAVKVAEGAFEDYDTWVMWRTTEGYRIEIHTDLQEFGKGASSDEVLNVTPDFNMNAIRYEIQNWSEMDNGVLDCTVGEKNLTCTSTFKHSQGTGTLSLAGGYAVQFGVHVAMLDMAWFYNTLVCYAPLDPQKSAVAGVVELALDDPPRYVMGTPRDATIKYMGTFPYTLFGKRLALREYDVSVRNFNARVWTTNKGLVVLVAKQDEESMQLTKFRQFEKFIPELPVDVQLTRQHTRSFSNVE